MTSFKEYYGTDKQSLLNEVIKAPFGAGNKVWNPWPNEPLPDPNDTRDYSKSSTTIAGGRKSVDIDSLLKQAGYSDMKYLSLPPAQQKQILDKVVKQFAAQSGIDMNSEWGRTMMQKAAQTSTSGNAHIDVIQNLYYANDQARKEASMTPQQRMQYASFGSTMAQQQKQIEDYIQKNPNKADRLRDPQFQKELGEYLTTKANLYPEKMTPLEKQELRNLGLGKSQYRQQAIELFNKNFGSGFKPPQAGVQGKQQPTPVATQSQPSQLAKAADIAYSANPTTTAPYNVGKALYNAGPGYAKAAYQSIANSPAIKPLNTSNIAQRVASNPLVRAANALSPANVVATGLGAYNNLKKNYDVNIGGSAGTSGVGIGGAITPKQTDLKRPSLYGGVGVTPGKGGWLTPTAQAYAGRVQYPTNIKAVPTSQPSATSLRSQPVTQTSTTARPASTQAYLPSTRSTVQQPVQQTSYQQAPRYSKSSVPGAIAFFQRYGRWPSESEL